MRMKQTHYPGAAILSLFLCLASYTTTFARQASKQIIPEPLRGYWQFKTEKVSDWNGPLIGETFVEIYYTIGYAEQIEKQADGSYFFHLKSNTGKTTTFRMSHLSGDSATIWYDGWKEPRCCVRRRIPSHTEMLAPTALPEGLYRKWVQDLDGKIRYEFTREGKMIYDGKTWDILSAGHYLNKEYRLLAKSGETYKLVYLSFPFPSVLNVAMELGNEQVTPFATRPEVYAITGCWLHRETGDWTVAFFENFAVYQCRFWNYESIRTQKGKNKITLKSGDERLSIEMERSGEKDCTLRIGKRKPQAYTLLADRLYPDYPQPDHTPFIDNGYTTDSVTVVGYLRHPKSWQPFEVAVPDMITDDEMEYKAGLDSLGRFTLRFPVLNTHQVFIDWGRSSISTVVEPGKTYFLFVDFSKGKRFFMGENARFPNELLSHEGLREYIDYDTGKDLSNDAYMKKALEIQQHKMEHREKTLREHPLLSDKYRYYTRQSIRYDTGYHLMQRRFSLNRNARERLAPEFLGYVDTTMYVQPVQPYTLVRDFQSFMRDYTGYISDITYSPKLYSYNTTQIANILERLAKAAKIKLSEEEIKNLSVGAEMPEEIKKPFQQYMQENMYVKNLQREMTILDSLGMEKKLQEILASTSHYKMLQDTHQELPDSIIDRLRRKVTNPSLLRYVLHQQQTYQEISRKEIAHLTSLKSNEPLKSITDGEALFREIIKPYKGKVIYLDVWGTWCGPCKAMMQYAGAVKKLFEGKDVIFLYLANHSSDVSWKNIIKEYQLTGESTVHYNLPEAQQNAVEKFLHIRSFPTYILIDKEGKIVTDKAPRPNQSDDLMNAVWKELDK